MDSLAERRRPSAGSFSISSDSGSSFLFLVDSFVFGFFFGCLGTFGSSFGTSMFSNPCRYSVKNSSIE